MEKDSLLALLQRKKNFFLAVLDLTKDEKTLSLSDLSQALKQKKVLLQCIRKIDKDIKEKLLQQTQSFPFGQIQRENDEIRLIIKHILSLDAENYQFRKRSLNYE